MKKTQNELNNDILEEMKRNQKLSMLSTISIIVIAVILFSFLIYGLYRINVLEVPQALLSLLNTQGISSIEEIEYDDSELLQLLKQTKSDEASVIYYDITEQDYAELLRDAPYITEYKLQHYIVYYTIGDRSRVTYTQNIFVKNDKYRIDRYETVNEGSGPIIKSISSDGEKVYVKDSLTYDSPVVREHAISEKFSMQNQAGLPSIDSFLNDSDVEDLQISLIRSENRNVFEVSYGYKSLPRQTEKLLISVDYGIVVEAETYWDGILIYHMYLTSAVGTVNENDKFFVLS